MLLIAAVGYVYWGIQLPAERRAEAQRQAEFQRQVEAKAKAEAEAKAREEARLKGEEEEREKVRLAAAAEKAAAEAKAREETRLKAETEEREQVRLAEQKAAVEAKAREEERLKAEAQEREKSRVAAAEEKAAAEAKAKAKAEAKAEAEAQRQAEAKAKALAALAPAPPTLGPGQHWTNSLGMVFAGVPGVPAFSIWETRVQDYQAFRRSWQKPDFTQGPTHPAVNVSWNDAQAFCRWLTDKERGEGRLTASQSYRLPTDAEWSVAVGLNEDSGGSPKDKDAKIKGVYPWGTQWPPPSRAGNYLDMSNAKSSEKAAAAFRVFSSYDDGYANTSPVGQFHAKSVWSL